MFVAAAVWTVYVWVTRISVIARDDHPAGFIIVHVGLAVVSIAFALAIGRIGVRALRKQRVEQRS